MPRMGAVWMSLATIASALLAFAGSAHAESGTSGLAERTVVGQWNVTGLEVIEDTILRVNGSILVLPEAELVLKHVTLIFEGEGFHAIASQLHGSDIHRSGIIRLLSTEQGPTTITSDAIDTNYFFNSWGPFEARGTPKHPVVIEHVAGSSGGGVEGQMQGLFNNGLQLIGPDNVLENVVFRLSRSGIGISSPGPTHIYNLTTYQVAFGLYLQKPHDLIVEKSGISGYRSALYAFNAEDIVVKDSVLAGDAFSVIGFGSNLTFTNNSFYTHGTSAGLSDGGAYHFERNRFALYNTTGILATTDLRKAGAVPPSVTLLDNVLDGRGVARSGMSLEITRDLRLERNVVTGHEGAGITVGLAQSATVVENVATRNGAHGIEIASAAFRESRNAFGSTPEEGNSHGGFVGHSILLFHVVDGAGLPVANATLVIEGDAPGLPATLTIPAGGVTGYPLEVLRIENNGTRREATYTVTASFAGLPTAQKVVVPVRDEGPYVLALVDEVESVDGAGFWSRMVPGASPFALLAAAAILAIARNHAARARR